jgi:hypothetical protein
VIAGLAQDRGPVPPVGEEERVLVVVDVTGRIDDVAGQQHEVRALRLRLERLDERVLRGVGFARVPDEQKAPRGDVLGDDADVHVRIGPGRALRRDPAHPPGVDQVVDVLGDRVVRGVEQRAERQPRELRPTRSDTLVEKVSPVARCPVGAPACTDGRLSRGFAHADDPLESPPRPSA